MAIELYKSPLYNDPDLGGYWRFEGNANDALGTNNGTGNNVTYGSSVGRFNRGAYFNGSNSNIVLPNASAIKPTGNFTISFWIRTLSGINNDQSVFSCFQIDNGKFWGFRTHIESNNVVDCIIARGTGETSGTDFVQTNGGPIVADGTWHHVTWTWDGSYINIYVDGVFAKKSACSFGPVYDAGSQPRIGNDYQSLVEGNYFQGSLDDVAIWSRALTADEIASLYNSYSKDKVFSVECWGGGGNGNGLAGGGGGGGAYSRLNAYAAKDGNYAVVVGGQGAQSYFKDVATCLAKGGANGVASGAGGAGGQSSAGVGDVKHSGGAGGAGYHSSDWYGGGGGGAAGPEGDGFAGAGGTGCAGGTGDYGSGGGGAPKGARNVDAAAGGDYGPRGGGGGAGIWNNGSGGNGGGPGGGGGGNNGGNTGVGAAGQVVIRVLTALIKSSSGGTKSTDGDYTIHTFTSSGTFSIKFKSAPFLIMF